MKDWLQKAGFNRIKIWEQPINSMIRDGEHFMSHMGDIRIKKEAESRNLTPEQVESLKRDVIALFDQLSEGTIRTIQVAVVLAFKD
mgnify:CR=1 FL=1